MEQTFDFPTEVIELPSKGLLYPQDNPLSSGKIEMKYMTAKEEDILTNQAYIQKGIVLDKLLQALIVSKINYNDLIIGDKNAIMVAARILGYGKDYTFEYGNQEYTVDLSQIDNKPFDHSNKGVNEFNYTLPSTNINITYKILTHSDEQKIQAEIDGLKNGDIFTIPLNDAIKQKLLCFSGLLDDPCGDIVQVKTLQDLLIQMIAKLCRCCPN